MRKASFIKTLAQARLLFAENQARDGHIGLSYDELKSLFDDPSKSFTEIGRLAVKPGFKPLTRQAISLIYQRYFEPFAPAHASGYDRYEIRILERHRQLAQVINVPGKLKIVADAARAADCTVEKIRAAGSKIAFKSAELKINGKLCFIAHFSSIQYRNNGRQCSCFKVSTALLQRYAFWIGVRQFPHCKTEIFVVPTDILAAAYMRTQKPEVQVELPRKPSIYKKPGPRTRVDWQKYEHAFSQFSRRSKVA